VIHPAWPEILLNKTASLNLDTFLLSIDFIKVSPPKIWITSISMASSIMGIMLFPVALTGREAWFVLNLDHMLMRSILCLSGFHAASCITLQEQQSSLPLWDRASSNKEHTMALPSYRHCTVVLISCLVLASCNINPTASNTSDSSVLSFNITGAKAVAAKLTENARSTGSASREIEDYSLIRINADNSLSAASSLQDPIGFLMTGKDYNLYVCLAQMKQLFMNGPFDFDSLMHVQLFCVHPDNSYDLLWPPEGKPVHNGIDLMISNTVHTNRGRDYLIEPVKEGPDGRIYFLTPIGIYACETASESAPVQVVPMDSSMDIVDFWLDESNHLFVLRVMDYPLDNGNNKFSLEFYRPGSVSPEYICHTSDYNYTWINACAPPAPDGSLVFTASLNGRQGLFKTTFDDAGARTQLLIYDQYGADGPMEDGPSNVPYSTVLDETSIMKVDGGAYSWSSFLLTNGVLDKSRLLAAFAPYFHGEVDISDANFNFLAGIDVNARPSVDWNWGRYTNNPLGLEIAEDVESFIKYYFIGTTIHDWGLWRTQMQLKQTGPLWWGSDGSLFGSGGLVMVKLLDAEGNISMETIVLDHSPYANKIKRAGDQLYFIYHDYFDPWQPGFKIARYGLYTGVDENLFTDPTLTDRVLCIDAFSLTKDGTTLYIAAHDSDANATTFYSNCVGSIDIATKVFMPLADKAAFDMIVSFE